jgi:hypothetical protein
MNVGDHSAATRSPWQNNHFERGWIGAETGG